MRARSYRWHTQKCLAMGGRYNLKNLQRAASAQLINFFPRQRPWVNTLSEGYADDLADARIAHCQDWTVYTPRCRFYQVKWTECVNYSKEDGFSRVKESWAEKSNFHMIVKHRRNKRVFSGIEAFFTSEWRVDVAWLNRWIWIHWFFFTMVAQITSNVTRNVPLALRNQWHHDSCDHECDRTARMVD